MQRQFNVWKNNHDLNEEKGWKHYKRWEQEMLFHTDPSGEIADQSPLFDEAIKVSENQRRNGITNNGNVMASSWSPVGPYNLPANQTGYMENGMGRINCYCRRGTGRSRDMESRC
mgnify:CR=1 FL=1